MSTSAVKGGANSWSTGRNFQSSRAHENGKLHVGGLACSTKRDARHAHPTRKRSSPGLSVVARQGLPRRRCGLRPEKKRRKKYGAPPQKTGAPPSPPAIFTRDGPRKNPKKKNARPARLSRARGRSAWSASISRSGAAVVYTFGAGSAQGFGDLKRSTDADSIASTPRPDGDGAAGPRAPRKARRVRPSQR